MDYNYSHMFQKRAALLPKTERESRQGHPQGSKRGSLPQLPLWMEEGGATVQHGGFPDDSNFAIYRVSPMIPESIRFIVKMY